MTETADEQYARNTEAYNDAEATIEEYVCGVCGNLLVVLKEDDKWVNRCGTDKSHEGLRPVPTATEVYRSGAAVAPYVSNAIERARPAVAKIETMAAIWMEKTRTLTPAAAYQAAIFSLQTGLDPRFREIACLEFGQGEVKVPQVMITEIGWRTLAARECADLFERAPVVTDVTDADEKARLGATVDSYVCVAHGTLLGDHPDLPIRRAAGIYTAGEFKRDQERHGPGGGPLPAAAWPQNQARARASRHWYEQNVPQAIERARQGWDATLQELDVAGAELVIEAQFKVLDEPRRPAAASGAEPGWPPEPRPREQQAPQQRREPDGGGPPITEKQIQLILKLADSLYGWDRRDVEQDIGGKALNALTVGQASQLIDKYKKAEAERSGQANMEGMR